MANDWAFSESMWMTDSRSGEPSEVDALSPDPWKIELGSTEELDNACGDERTLSSDDFSSMSLEQCQDLVGFVNTNSDHDTSNNLQFEVDQTYLSKLERRLEKLYRLSGKAEKSSMIKQMSDRVEGLFSGSNERVDSSVGDEPLKINPLAQRLFPEQQALTAEEKLELVKSDHLSIQSEELDGVVPSDIKPEDLGQLTIDQNFTSQAESSEGDVG